jgi:hypothetical protein
VVEGNIRRRLDAGYCGGVITSFMRDGMKQESNVLFLSGLLTTTINDKRRSRRDVLFAHMI